MKKTVLHNCLFLCMIVFCLLFASCGQADDLNSAGMGDPSASATETSEGSGKPDISETENPADNDKGTVSMQLIPENLMWKLMATSRDLQRRIKQKNPLSSTVNWIRWEDVAWRMQMWEKT